MTGIIILLRRYTSEVGRFAKHAANPNVGLFNHLKGLSVINGRSISVASEVQKFIEENIDLCQPESVHICDGSENENKQLLNLLQQQKTIIPLPKYQNCWLARTNPADTARVESKTFICTEKECDTIPKPVKSEKGQLGNWICPTDMDAAIQERFPGCMKGRTMYVIPYSMGPVNSPLAKYGVQLTDCAYVVASMRIMTRIGNAVMERINEGAPFVRCLHSVGTPEDGNIDYPYWPCDPKRTIILHKPATNEIVSYGSGYGGNSLLGKKCFALRLGSTIAQREGWLAEHMLILGITNLTTKEKRYIAAAFPSACGKTNLAMMTPSLPNYKVECVGDDIAWMRFNTKGELRAINPENGFFGVAPGTSTKSNPVAMQTIFKNTIFTNVACTSDGGVFWEGLEEETDPELEITDWLGEPWERGSTTKAAQPNSRFCTPAKQCPIIDPHWEDPEGVPISAILFGGRRPKGVPLVFEARDWVHGCFIGAAMRSEATAAAEFKGKIVMHDPFAMRPFFGYNFGHYLDHWLSMQKKSSCLPKIYHVNWFRKNEDGQFLWPGYGENSRVLDWIIRRVDGEDNFKETPIGNVPKTEGGLNLSGLEHVDLDALMDVPKEFWLEEVEAIEKFFHSQVGEDLPKEIYDQLEKLRTRLEKIED